MLSQLHFVLKPPGSSSSSIVSPLSVCWKCFVWGDPFLVWSEAGGVSCVLESLKQVSLPCAHSKPAELGIWEKTILLASNNPGKQLKEELDVAGGGSGCVRNETEVCSRARKGFAPLSVRQDLLMQMTWMDLEQPVPLCCSHFGCLRLALAFSAGDKWSLDLLWVSVPVCSEPGACQRGFPWV